MEEDEANVRSKAETRSDVLLFANLYSAIFVLLRHLVTLNSLVMIALTVFDDSLLEQIFYSKLFSHGLLFITQPKSDPFLY